MGPRGWVDCRIVCGSSTAVIGSCVVGAICEVFKFARLARRSAKVVIALSGLGISLVSGTIDGFRWYAPMSLSNRWYVGVVGVGWFIVGKVAGGEADRDDGGEEWAELAVDCECDGEENTIVESRLGSVDPVL